VNSTPLQASDKRGIQTLERFCVMRSPGDFLFAAAFQLFLFQSFPLFRSSRNPEATFPFRIIELTRRHRLCRPQFSITKHSYAAPAHARDEYWVFTRCTDR
jgi:hypothetical protein